MNSTRPVVALGVAIVTGGLLAGCGVTQPDSVSDAFTPGIDEPTTVSLWYTYPNLFDSTIASIVETCEAEVPNLTIDAQTVGAEYNDLNQRVQTAIAAGEGPDLVLEGLGNVEALSDLPAVNDLADLVSEDQAFEDLASFLPLGRGNNDVQVGVPYAVSVPVLHWNREHFAAAGLDPDRPPTTIDELLDDAELLADPATGRVGLSIDYVLSNNFSVPTIMANAGAGVVENGRPVFDSPESVELLELLAAGAQDGSVGIYADNSQSGQAFQTQQSSMHIGSISSLPQRLDTLGPVFGTTRVPNGSDYTGDYQAFASGNMWTMYSDTDSQRRASAEALRCFTSPEVTKLPFINSGYLPGSPAALDDPDVQALLDEQPERQAGIDAMGNLAKLPAFAGRDGARAADIFRDAWVLSFIGEEGAEQALTDAAREIEALDVE